MGVQGRHGLVRDYCMGSYASSTVSNHRVSASLAYTQIHSHFCLLRCRPSCESTCVSHSLIALAHHAAHLAPLARLQPPASRAVAVRVRVRSDSRGLERGLRPETPGVKKSPHVPLLQVPSRQTARPRSTLPPAASGPSRIGATAPLAVAFLGACSRRLGRAVPSRPSPPTPRPRRSRAA